MKNCYSYIDIYNDLQLLVSKYVIYLDKFNNAICMHHKTLAHAYRIPSTVPSCNTVLNCFNFVLYIKQVLLSKVCIIVENEGLAK